jgi:hypothetical protein
MKSSIPIVPPVMGTADASLCGVVITAIPLTEENWVMGGFWIKPSQTTTNVQRSNLQHDQALMLQQYLAAVLNNHLFGSSPPGGLAKYRTDYCTGTDTTIQHDIGILDTFNTTGDSGAFTPGASASPQTAQAQADIDAWDGATPTSKTARLIPGPSGDESSEMPILMLSKIVNNTPAGGGTAKNTDFTLTATCSTGGCTAADNKSNPGGFAASVHAGTYTLSETPDAFAAPQNYSASSWTCSGSGSFNLSGSSTLMLSNGASVSCSITNTK